MFDLSDRDYAAMMLKIVGPARCDGEDAATWLRRESCVEELLTISLANMRSAGLEFDGYLPLAIDHAIEVVSDTHNKVPCIDSGRLARLANMLGGQMLPSSFRQHIRQSAMHLASEVKTMTEASALSA